MTKIIEITPAESSNVEMLFSRYNSYLAIMGYFVDRGSTDTTNHVFDKKWTETADLYTELENAKRAIEKKYKPAGDWDSFEFDFENHQVVFKKDEP